MGKDIKDKINIDLVITGVGDPYHIKVEEDAEKYPTVNDVTMLMVTVFEKATQTITKGLPMAEVDTKLNIVHKDKAKGKSKYHK